MESVQLEFSVLHHPARREVPKMGEKGSRVKGLGRKKGWPDGLEREKPLLGLPCPVGHLKKIRSFRCGGRAVGCQNMWDGTPDEAPHFPVGSRRERERRDAGF